MSHFGPRGHAVKVAGVLRLGQGHEIGPREQQRVFHLAIHPEPPFIERDIGLVAQIQHGPFSGGGLANRDFGHSVAVGCARAQRTGTGYRRTGQHPLPETALELHPGLNDLGQLVVWFHAVQTKKEGERL